VMLRSSEELETPPARQPGAFFVVDGPGFVTGIFNKVTVTASSDGRHWISVGGDLPKRIDGEEFEASGRCSRWGGVGPLEHLSAALGIAGWNGWHLHADHPDLPLFDGSARVWYESALSIFAGSIQNSLESSLKCEETLQNDRGGWIRVRPAPRFRLQVTWSAGPEGAESWVGGEKDLSEIVHARTFIDLDVFLALRAQGDLLGTDADAGRLLRGRNSLYPSAFALAEDLGVDPQSRVWTGGLERMRGECAAHKALDLVGDILLWLGYLPCLEVVAHDAGHALHHRLGALLRASRPTAFSE